MRSISQSANVLGNASFGTAAGSLAAWAADYESLIMIGVSVASLVVLIVFKTLHYLLEKNRATKPKL